MWWPLDPVANDGITIVPANSGAAAEGGTDDATGAAAEELSLIGASTFLESFAGVLDGASLVNHCRTQHSPDAYRQYLSSGAKAWLAQLDGAPIGYAMICAPDLEAAKPGDIELKRIYLLSKFHGRGIAGQLMDAVLGEAQGHERLLLGVKADNERAIAFYKKQGFDQIAVRQFNVGGTLYDDLVMARQLGTENT